MGLRRRDRRTAVRDLRRGAAVRGARSRSVGASKAHDAIVAVHNYSARLVRLRVKRGGCSGGVCVGRYVVGAVEVFVEAFVDLDLGLGIRLGLVEGARIDLSRVVVVVVVVVEDWAGCME